MSDNSDRNGAQPPPPERTTRKAAAEHRNAVKRGDKVEMTCRSHGNLPVFNPGLQAFLIRAVRFDPRKEIRALHVPVLIVNGDNDLKIPSDNAEALAPGAAEKIRRKAHPALDYGS